MLLVIFLNGLLIQLNKYLLVSKQVDHTNSIASIHGIGTNLKIVLDIEIFFAKLLN